jgi:NHLM bacteriocin system ABC transporter peptidase/ATP-binding protein
MAEDPGHASTPAASETAGDDRKPKRRPPRRRVKAPTVLQMEAVECGAAALAIVLAYHQLWVPLEELRHECGVSRDGSKASNVLRAARKYGVEAKGFKYENLDDLYDLRFPVILFWNFNHFVVLEGFRGDKVFLNDPAQGPRVITHDELDASYSGVVLTFSPGPEFRRGGTPPNLVPALRRRLKGSGGALLYVIACGLLLVVPGLLIPTFTRVFIDEYLKDGQRWLVQPLMLVMALTVLVQGVLTWLQRYYLLRLETKLSLATSAHFFNHVLRLPAAYFGQRFAGEIGSRVAINDKVADVVSGKLATTVIDSVMTVFYAALMFAYDVTLTALVIGLAMLNVLAVRLASRVRVDASRRLQLDRGKLTGTAMNGLRMIETLKAGGSEGEFFSRWSGYYAKSVNTKQRLGVIAQLSAAVPPFVQTMSTAAVLALGGLKIMSGDTAMTVGMLVAYQTLLASFTRPLNSFVEFGAMLQELQADANRLDDVLKYPQDAQYAAEATAAPEGPRPIKLTGKVEVRGLTFGYSPLDKPLIKDFSLSVEPGRRVAIVGGSGSGKSTVAKLVSGLYKPWSGEILFDGVAREALRRDLIVNSVGMVDQDVFLFGGTAAENITMWDPTIASARIGAACRDASIADVIESREGGYQTAVVEGGGNFSGGQCQRLEIARALVGEPSLLILDEATSALDPSTEAWIDDSIRRRGCTCIIVAHRLSTIKDCDEIVVMDRGRIVQRGTHEEMKDVDGPYRRLISLH